MEPVVTERLIVRRVRESDLDDFLAYQTHPEVLRYLPAEPMTEEKARSSIGRQIEMEAGAESGYVLLAIEHRDTGRMIGEVGIFLLPKEESCGDIGWIIHPDFQRQGYATEAAGVLLDHAFTRLDLRRVTSACDARNPASYGVMERLGMRREGHLRQSRCTQGVWHDEYHYALLRDEWRAR